MGPVVGDVGTILGERARRLREETLAIQPFVSAERADLVTAFYAEHGDSGLPTPILRARCFEHVLTRRTLYLGPDELIVGERGPSPKATPTYPELCCHSLEDFEARARASARYLVPDEVRRVYADRIIPFWRGRTIRERLFASMTPEWLAAFDAGVFTEFMEQRAPGHAILDDKIYRRGMLDFKAEIEAVLARADDPAHRDQLTAMGICCDALVAFAHRYAELARQLAQDATPERRAELLRIADVCEWVPAHAPRTFHEALQAYWFVHLGVITELNTWDSFNPGRLDQHLWPFYSREVGEGSYPGRCRGLLQCWVKFNNQPAPQGRDHWEQAAPTRTSPSCAWAAWTATADAVSRSLLVLDVVRRCAWSSPAPASRSARSAPMTSFCRPLASSGPGWGNRQSSTPMRSCAVSCARKDHRGCPRRRAERVCRGLRLRQGELHADRLLQLAEDRGACAQRWCGSPHWQASGAGHG